MKQCESRTPVPVLAGRLVTAAYTFSNGSHDHGVVLTLDDDSDVSIEFSSQTYFSCKILRCEEVDSDAVEVQSVQL